MKICSPAVDYVINPQFIKTENLRFGWKTESDKAHTLQKSYRIVITDTDGTVCDTGVVESDKMCDIAIPSLKLKSDRDYEITIASESNHGETGEISFAVHTALTPDDWGNAQWIKPAQHITGWAPYLRTKFTAPKVKKAYLYASGLGIAEYTINGKKVGDGFIDPPISNYEKTVYYRAYDITGLIAEGKNAIAVLLGEGFYSQSRVWGREGMVYGDVCAIAKLEIISEDGSITTVVTDTDTWKSHYSPVTVNNIYGGETYDCRLEIPDFCNADSSDDGWSAVTEDLTPKGGLTLCLMPEVKIIRKLPAVKLWGSSGNGDGTWIYDIGENIAGICEFHLPPSPVGAVYVFRFAETLNSADQMDYRSSGAFATQCIQQEIYIARGDAEGETYRPRLCYHGFRYVEISGIHDFSKGYGTTPQLSIVKGLALSTAFEKTSSFETSYEPLNKLMKVMDNTYRSNFHGVPEDCPAREKCGWLGDAQIVCNYGLLTYDSMSAYEKYLSDIKTSAEVYGVWQMIAPGKRGCGSATPLWGCAQILIPYYMWKYHGDREAVAEYLPLMEKWIAYEGKRADDYTISEGLGDWCPPGGNENPERIPVIQSSTFMYYEVCDRMEEICAGFMPDKKEKYHELKEKIADSIIRHFYDPGKHTYGYQASDAIALTFGICPDGDYSALLTALINSIQADDCAMTTGIYGNKYLVPLLFHEGYGDTALEILFNTRHPSFGTMLEDGATSMWEQPDMLFHETRPLPSVSSYNHPMHGGFLYFVYLSLCGISPLDEGFRKFSFSPRVSEKLRSFSFSFTTPYGKIAVSREGDVYTLTVPCGCECVTDSGDVLGSGEYMFDNVHYTCSSIVRRV